MNPRDLRDAYEKYRDKWPTVKSPSRLFVP